METVSYFSSWIYFVIAFFFLVLVNGSTTRSQKKMAQIAFVIIFLFAICRFNFGNDYPRYWNQAAGLDDLRLESHMKSIEVISNAIMNISYSLHFPPLLFVVFSTISLFSYRFVIKRYSNIQALSWYFYFTFPLLFFQDCSTIRQSGAMAMFLLAFPFVDHGKFFKGALLLSIGVLFHTSAIIGLLLLLLPFWKRISLTANVLFFFLSFIGGIVLKEVVLSFISSLGISGFSYYIDNPVEGFNIFQYLLFAINILNFLFFRRLYNDNQKNVLYITLVNVGICLFNLFSFESVTATRACCFFFVFQIFLMPSYRNVLAKAWKSTSLANFALVSIMFALQISMVFIYINAYNNKMLSSAVYAPYQVWFNHI